VVSLSISVSQRWIQFSTTNFYPPPSLLSLNLKKIWSIIAFVMLFVMPWVMACGYLCSNCKSWHVLWTQQSATGVYLLFIILFLEQVCRNFNWPGTWTWTFSMYQRWCSFVCQLLSTCHPLGNNLHILGYEVTERFLIVWVEAIKENWSMSLSTN